MSYPQLALFVVLSGLAAAGLCMGLHYLLHRDTFRRCHELGSAVFIQLGVVFAVLLAFVFNDVWSDYQSTAEAINKECASLHGVAILSQSLPASSRDATLAALRTYLHTVIDREWPAMRRRSKSLEAQQRFQTLWQTAATADTNPAQNQIISQMLVLLDEAHESRETRVFQMTQSVPGLVWAMLALFAAGLIMCMLLFSTETPTSKAVFVGVFTSCLTLALLTVHILDFPFENVLQLPSHDFNDTLGNVDLLLAATPRR